MDITNMINETQTNGGHVLIMSDLHLLKKEKDKPRITINPNHEKAIENINRIRDIDMLIFLGDIVDDTINEDLFKEEMKIFDRPMEHKIWIRGNNDLFADHLYEDYGFEVCYSAMYKTDKANFVFSHTSLDVSSRKNLYCVHGHMHNNGAEMLYYHDPVRCLNIAQNFTSKGESIGLAFIEDQCTRFKNNSRWYPGQEKIGMSQFVQNMAYAEMYEDLYS